MIERLMKTKGSGNSRLQRTSLPRSVYAWRH